MTLDEYCQLVLGRIKAASSLAMAREEINQAARDTSGLTDFDRRTFWSSLRIALDQEDVVVKRQGAAALSAIIQAAQQAIATYVQQSK